MSAKHTRGPWEVRENSDSDVFIMAGDDLIAEVEGNWPEPSRANGRLIAAAPDLLEACEAVLSDTTAEGSPEKFLADRARCRAAIAKARGE